MQEITDLLTKAVRLRDDYADEIPEQIVRGELRFKVQKNWLNLVTSTVFAAIMRSRIDSQEVIDQYHALQSYLRETNIGERDTTRTDIDKGNELVESVIQYCQGRVWEHQSDS